MNYAYCLLYTNKEDAIELAIKTYEEIIAANENDAVAFYRYGQALRRKKDMSKAISQLGKAVSILDRKMDPKIPGDHWIHSAALRELGYTHWLISSEVADVGEKLDHLHRAIIDTKAALEISLSVDDRIRGANNLVYFAWEERQLVGASGEWLVSDTEFKHQLNVLRSIEGTDPVAGVERYAVLDTVCRAFELLGQPQEASEVAVEVMDILIAKVGRRSGSASVSHPDLRLLQKHLTVDEFDAYLFAASSLQKVAHRK
jgi:tetratricopeptide (TPR) repeat protein